LSDIEMSEAVLSADARREPVLRVVPGPTDINSNGHIFGGWILSQMDIAGGIIARRLCRGPCATVSINAMDFVAPIHIRDIISVYGEVVRVGRTSMAIQIVVIATRGNEEEQIKVTEGLFTFVALDDHHRPKPLPELG
jgi:acyl-CoA thioesterase YciA